MNSIYLVLDGIWQWVAERVFVRFEFEMPLAELREHFRGGDAWFKMTSGGLVEWLILSSWCRREGFGPILVTNRMRLLFLGKPLCWLAVVLRNRTLVSVFQGADTAGPRLIFSRPDERRKLFSPSPVEKLLAAVYHDRVSNQWERPLVFVPVLITWRKYQRGASRNASEYFFGLSSRPNVIGKIWYLIRRRKDSMVKGLSPFSMRDCAAGAPDNILGEDDAMRVAKMVRRKTIVAIKEEMRILLGPRYVSPTAVKETLLHDSEVQKTLSEMAQEGQLDKRKMMLGAYRMLSEIVADYSYRFVEVLYALLAWLFTRVFDGLDYREDELEKLRGTLKQKPVVFVSAHRSHLDYLVIPYLLFLNDIVTPHIAAGVNLSFWPVGGLLRKCGAFFIRRSFKGDRLYGLLLKKYVWSLTQNRFNILFFIEGTRSRTGKMLPPTYGMLKMIMNGFQKNLYEDIALVPVSLSYDEVLEQSSYATELAGGQKEKENARALIRSRSVISRNIGKVYVRLADPVSIRELFRAAQVSDLDDKHILQKTAFDLCVRINSVTPLTPKSLLASILLSQADPVTLEQVGLLADFLFRYAHATGHQTTASDEDSSRRAIELLLRQFQRSGLIQAVEGSLPLAFEVDRSRRVAMVFYRNNAIHCFVVPALAQLALSLAAESTERSKDLSSGVECEKIVLEWGVRLRNLFKFDFFFSGSRDFTAELSRAVSHLSGLGRWQREPINSVLAAVNRNSESRMAAGMFQTLLGELIESYAIVFRFAKQNGDLRLDRKALLQRVLKESQNLIAREALVFPESASIQNFGSAVLLLENLGLVETQSENDKPTLLIGGWRSEPENMLLLCENILKLAANGATPLGDF